MSKLSVRLLLSTALVPSLAMIVAAPAAAQDQGADETADERVEDDFHDRRVNAAGEIVVTAAGVTQLDILAGSAILETNDLQRNLDGQLGTVLEKLPGVASSGFSPGASRPILRGFSGERVKVLVDGIGAIDASNTSDDHAVSIDPLTAERIEVLRGPAVILYGSQAIGGAVNVIDKRIPQRVPNEPFHLDTIITADTASNLLQGGASLDVPIGPNFVVHMNGSYRNSDDIDVPGFTASSALRADLLADAVEEEDEGEFEEAEELREAANQSGFLPNSGVETWSGDIGFAVFAGESNLGASFGMYGTLYGVPGRPGAGHHHGEEEGGEGEAEEEEGEELVTIDLRQYRADLRGKLAFGGGIFSELRTRVGYSDYTHTEFEGDAVGTVFEVQGIEARAELVQTPQDNWRGSIGLQYTFRDFKAIGEEAFVAPNRTNQIALSGLQEFELTDNVQLEGALRYEKTDVSSNALGVERDYGTVSGAISLAYETNDGLRFGVTGSRAERAPAAEELFSNGPHIATQAFEIGDINLDTEKAWGVEAFVRGNVGPASVNFAVFHNAFDDYIFLAGTGLEEDDLPVFQFLQDDANYFGIEGQVTMPLVDSGPFTLLADLRGDYIKAELSDGTPLPRIPALNFLGALEAQTSQIDGRIEAQWFDSQNDVAPFETPTDSFTLVNASIAWRPLKYRSNITVMLQADNIFDVEGRRHTSFTKDFVPNIGRNFKVSVRTSF
ncbi:TonB-dependent receptor [Pontixanthobacter aquaemixtae]|uniref:TonB-dependent receptor n=1 Tax=Pontixanthobacter aquaemixtae TaxID=1958940 RepID=A0A844ZWY4_9SPHN|nr:TonB-dependent receptor [Pontixanthobacter aquaemixtae]MXO91690.1 TonB-dependent receptor [Pontixanthobacter aquaemixtae]